MAVDSHRLEGYKTVTIAYSRGYEKGAIARHFKSSEVELHRNCHIVPVSGEAYISCQTIVRILSRNDKACTNK